MAPTGSEARWASGAGAVLVTLGLQHTGVDSAARLACPGEVLPPIGGSS